VHDDTPMPIVRSLAERGVSRRDFLKFCGLMAATLALPASSADTIAKALSAATRVPLIWSEFQDCTADTESFLRGCRRPDPALSGVTDPGVTEILLDVLSVDYHETLMVPSGFMAEKSRYDTLQAYSGQYLYVVEGSIPTAHNGAYCTIGGRTALSIVQELAAHARATIALGACAWDGGLAAAAPNPTGAVGLRTAVPGLTNVVGLPGCPANVVNLVASIVYILTYNQLPRIGEGGRPAFAYNDEVHERCERHRFNEADKYVLAWGDYGHQHGWCLERMGCKGPETHHNCPTVKWNGGTCWPIAAGHGCIGCSESHFWDRMTPFYAGEVDD
jgi:hydrogenase small subunit